MVGAGIRGSSKTTCSCQMGPWVIWECVSGWCELHLQHFQHKGFDDAQLGIFVEQAHIIFQETRDIIWGHINGFLVLSRKALGGLASILAASSMVCLFLATIAGLMSFDFAVKTLSFLYELGFLGLGVLLSSSQDISIDIHSVSALGNGMPPLVVSSRAMIFGWNLPGGYSEGSVESLAILGGGLPFVVG